LDELGLAAVLRDAGTQFANRTGVLVELTCVQLTSRLPADTELALYRILQETLKNVEKHARARHVTIHLAKLDEIVQLTINDDGIGFDPDHLPVGSKGKGGFGLLGIRERASSVGGVLKINSIRRVGTEIDVHIPLRQDVTAANGVARKLLTKD
jgi:signal transduction histidine kinase